MSHVRPTSAGVRWVILIGVGIIVLLIFGAIGLSGVGRQWMGPTPTTVVVTPASGETAASYGGLRLVVQSARRESLPPEVEAALFAGQPAKAHDVPLVVTVSYQQDIAMRWYGPGATKFAQADLSVYDRASGATPEPGSDEYPAIAMFVAGTPGVLSVVEAVEAGTPGTFDVAFLVPCGRNDLTLRYRSLSTQAVYSPGPVYQLDFAGVACSEP